MVLGGKRLRREGSAQQVVSPAEERTRLATIEAEKHEVDKPVGSREVVAGMVSFTGNVSRKIAQVVKKPPQEPRAALGIHGEDEE